MPGSPVTNISCRRPEGARKRFQLGRTAHEIGRRGGFDRRGREGAWKRDSAGRHHQPVAAPVTGLDVARAAGVVGERAAQLLDAGRQRIVTDRATAPHAIEELLLGDDLLRAFCQRAEHGGGARRQLDHAAVAAELAAARVEPNLAEGELPIHGHLDHARFPGTLPELSQDLTAAGRETCRTRPNDRQSTSPKAEILPAFAPTQHRSRRAT
jgi:hypothetical protein